MTEKTRLYLNFAGYLAVVVLGSVLGVGCGSRDEEIESVPSNMPDVVYVWVKSQGAWQADSPAVANRATEGTDSARYDVQGPAELFNEAEPGCRVTWSEQSFECPTLGLVKCPTPDVFIEVDGEVSFRIPPKFLEPTLHVDISGLVCSYKLNTASLFGRIN